MLDLLFLAGQAASAILLLYGGYLAVFSSYQARRKAGPAAVAPESPDAA